MSYGKIVMNANTANGERHNENLGYYNIDMDNYASEASVMATALDTIGRAFIANTTNSYSDTTLEITLSANEILAS